MVVKINGIDITDYIAFGGLKWSRNDVDGSNAGRTMSGMMIRDRVSTKIRLDINCRPLESAELKRLLNLIRPEFITVQYDDPMIGTRTVTMYSNNNPATYCIKRKNGKELWNEISFPLIER